jgi:hypothetical protein
MCRTFIYIATCTSTCDERKLLPEDILSECSVVYLFKARTAEPEKQPLLCNGCVTRNNGVTVGSGVFCEVHAKAI